MRTLVILTTTLMSGCTVGWLDLRAEHASKTAWQCPAAVQVSYASSIYTNTFGEKRATSEEDAEAAQKYEATVGRVLTQLGCGESSLGAPLIVEIQHLHKLSALPQEWLTGLSFGLIPSWGTRPAEARFTFIQGNEKASYVVDKISVNHLFLFPVFWVSYLLADFEQEFTKALMDYAGTS